MNPPPNSLTFVNVCTSPDRFSKLKAVPGCMVPSAGEKSHELVNLHLNACRAYVEEALDSTLPKRARALNLEVGRRHIEEAR